MRSSFSRLFAGSRCSMRAACSRTPCRACAALTAGENASWVKARNIYVLLLPSSQLPTSRPEIIWLAQALREPSHGVKYSTTGSERMRVDRIEDFQAFVTIVEKGSLTAAARSLGRSLQSVSRSLAALEADVGVELVRRTTRRSNPTEAGIALHRRLSAALAEIEAAKLEATERRSEAAGLLRVTASTAFTPLYLVPVAAAFLVAYPKVEIELEQSDGYVDLVGEGFDLAIRIGDLPDFEFARRGGWPSCVAWCLRHPAISLHMAGRGIRTICAAMSASSVPRRATAAHGRSASTAGSAASRSAAGSAPVVRSPPTRRPCTGWASAMRRYGRCGRWSIAASSSWC